MANTDRGIVMLSTVAGIFWTGRVVSLVVYVSTWFAHNGYIASQLGGAGEGLKGHRGTRVPCRLPIITMSRRWL